MSAVVWQRIRWHVVLAQETNWGAIKQLELFSAAKSRSDLSLVYKLYTPIKMQLWITDLAWILISCIVFKKVVHRFSGQEEDSSIWQKY